MEALTGGNGFAGRSAGAPHNSNGNLTLTEFSADFAAGGALPATPTFQVNLQNATASFNQASYNIAEAIDGIAHGNDNGWAISGGQTSPQTAVFQTDGSIDTNRLVFEIDQTTTFAAHKMQEFRLSYTTDANPTEGDASINWIEITPKDASTSLAASDAAINLASNTVSITGSSAVPDIYQIIAEGDFLDVTGFQLEALLGANGNVGFGGNIVLSEFNVFAQVVPEPAGIAIWLVLGLALCGYGYRQMRAKKA